MKNLSPQEQSFAEGVVSGLPATKAAIQAGYAPTHARNRGSKLLKKPKIRAYIELRRAAVVATVQAETNVTLARLLQETARPALADVKDIYGENGSVLPVPQMPEDIRRSISSVEVTETYALVRLPASGTSSPELALIRTTKIKFNDKLRAIETYAKLAGYVKEDNGALSGEITLVWSDEP